VIPQSGTSHGDALPLKGCLTAREFGAFAALPGPIAVMLTAKSGLGGKFPAET
jgi:hypothetical protein